MPDQDEAAAAMAAVEMFISETTQTGGPLPHAEISAWQKAALLEGVERSTVVTVGGTHGNW